MTSPPKFEDAGEHVPYARKHLAVATGKQAGDGARLADLFPEPEWAALIDAGMPADCAAHLAMVYESMATSPKKGGMFGLSDAQWLDAYIEGVAMMKEFFAQARTVEQAKSAASWMAAHWKATPKSIAAMPVARTAAYWAVGGGGSRRAKPPGALTPRQSLLAQWMHRMGWPGSDLALRANIFPVQLSESKKWVPAELVGTRFRLIGDPTPSVEEALDRAIAEAQRRLGLAKSVGRKPDASLQQRVGPSVLPAQPVTPEVLMGTYGLRAVQFGESVPQSERQMWMERLFEALSDFSAVLGLPGRSLGLGGLAIAIGARGKGGAVAHYEPSLRVVNFTRASGAGSLAHEWWHAFDHKWVSHLKQSSLMACVRLVPPASHGRLLAAASVFGAMRDQFRGSEFERCARNIAELPRARSYWVDPEEMAARAFEAWVEDRLLDMGRRSPYLVTGTRVEDYTSDASCFPYPAHAERQALSSQFARIIDLAASRVSP